MRDSFGTYLKTALEGTQSSVTLRMWAAEQARLHIEAANKSLTSPWLPDEAAFAAQADIFLKYVDRT